MNCLNKHKVEISSYTPIETVIGNLWDLKRVAQKANLSEKRIKELTAAGYLPFVTIDGGEPLYRWGDVKNFIKENLVFENEGVPFPKTLSVLSFSGISPTKVPKELQTLERQLYELPKYWVSSCVYFLIKNEKIVYIGQSVNVLARKKHHENSKLFDFLFFLPVPESNLSICERTFIKHFKPVFNKESFKNSYLINEEIEILKKYHLFNEGKI